MKFFLDTGNKDDIEAALPWGIVDGVTTNPSIIAKTGRPREEVVGEICSLVDGPVSAEVVSVDTEGMIHEAKALSEIHPNIVVKLPLTPNGIKACVWCRDNTIKTNVTLCFSLAQALLAAKSGATYISPFIGRLDDIGNNGLQLIADIRKVYDNYNFSTKILAASVRSTAHVQNVALLGADVATMPLSIMEKLFYHPLTDSGLAKFLSDHKKSHA